MSSIRDGVYERLVTHIQNGTTDQADAELHVPVRHFASAEHLAKELGGVSPPAARRSDGIRTARGR